MGCIPKGPGRTGDHFGIERGKLLDGYFGTGPEWKATKAKAVRTMTLQDLRAAGYGVDAAIAAAKNGMHPLFPPIMGK